MALSSRVTPVRAREILQEELDRVGWDAASAFTIMDGARTETADLAWWHQNTPPNESSDTQRNQAYIRAYERIANGQPLWAGGINLTRRTLWMDRSVVSRLERDGYLLFIDKGSSPYFEVTEKGRVWIDGE